MAKRGEVVLKVSGLRRAFGPVTILDKFNLEVRAGEAVALTGRNGAGKSTLLRCLVGADKPDDGSITVCGTELSETAPEIRRDMATVIDDLDFFPDLSVVEHLDLLARAHGLGEPEPVVDEILHEVQLIPQSGQLPGTLSSGQRRRLALATAFVRPRKLLILDEPEQRLDTEGIKWLSGRLAEERNNGLAIVFASHEPTLVNSVATRILHLGAARAEAGAPTGQSLAEPSLQAGAADPALVEQVGAGAPQQTQTQQPKKKPKPSQGRKKQQNRPKSPSENRNR
ncbi:ABC-type multidrug transport system, ATPase component [Microlunatus soli]|uniref:ABC-type multidrug transport system, ATPase component n=1 Tax=Microlunatus soli TaxID=630515 RepID=A0A1H1W0X0_9ACTN|nr:ABC-type multidrug transport system, ATPase component [Microlunatus soli]